ASVPSDRVGKPLIGLISVLGWLETPSPCLSRSLHQGSCRYTAFGMVSRGIAPTIELSVVIGMNVPLLSFPVFTVSDKRIALPGLPCYVLPLVLLSL
ncbi:MAG TPA: hypothetical protein VFB12_05865, partial [Ktedonobacteraceae bacterium]|nr:hypothetical protein [Ktedonobacteraceae bacterium]